MQSVLQDLRYEMRQLAAKPGFTIIAVLTLALGAGANALMFTVIDAVLLLPLPYAHPGQLVDIQSLLADGVGGSTSLPNFLDLKAQNQSFSAMAAYDHLSASIRLPNGEPVHSTGVQTTASLFDLLGVGPALGHAFGAGDDQAGKPCKVVLSNNFWREHLSADPHAIERNIVVDGQSCSISGIMPADFSFPSRDVGFWIALQPTPNMEIRGSDFLQVIARMKPGVSLSRARSEMKIIQHNLENAHPDDDKGYSIALRSYRDEVVGDAQPALLALLGAVALLLLIACANIANLQLARALGRKREMAIRSALGAGRMRVARQLFTENLVLALAGTGVGLWIAASAVGLLKHLAGNAIPRVEEISLRPQICMAMVILAGLSAVLFGLAPVLQVARQDIEKALRESAGVITGGRGQQKFRDILVVAQLSLAIVLVAGSGLLLRTLYTLLNTDRGFATEHVLTMQTALSGMEEANANLATTVYGPELEQIRQIPGVRAAGFITFLPLSNGHATVTFTIKGTPNPDLNSGPHAALNAASDDFFRALEIPLLRGRFFTEQDDLKHPPVGIINDVLARTYFNGQDPIGRQVHFQDPDSEAHPVTIVGVVRASRQLGLATPPQAEIYLDFRQVPPATIWSQFLLKQIMTYVVRGTGEPAALSNSVQQAIHRIDGSQTIFHVATMQEIVSSSVQSRRLGAILLSVFAGLALVVAAAGLYGVLSYMITQRTRDIAVRMALGASHGEVVGMIVRRALKLFIIGLVAGVAGVIWSGHLLSAMISGVRPWDPAALLTTTTVLLAVTLLAAWFPARRAASIEPHRALRSE